ncbi:MAG: tRNA pseudouridine(54/55) synthase Pus10 [Candidatus Hermodarchaeota archaeon]
MTTIQFIILEKAYALLESINLCNNCLGRQFASLLTGLTNAERGKSIKTALALEYAQTFISSPESLSFLQKIADSGLLSASETLKKYDPQLNHQTLSCRLCEDIFSNENLERICQQSLDKVKNVEFSTFLVGSVIPARIIDKEDEMRSKFGLEFGENIKSELNREIGKKLLVLFKEKLVNLKNPDIVFLVDCGSNSVSLQINPLFIYGRYKKLVRDIPQAKWHCKECFGKGCEKCNHTGKLYPISVEELIVNPLLPIVNSTEGKFHGSGREDIDARMLGSGRPFVVELKNAHKRHFDLKKAENTINQLAQGKILVSLTKFSSRDRIREIKTQSTSMSKSYILTIALNKDLKLSDEVLHKTETFFEGTIIAQQTPHRVSHRRANRVRYRKVYSLRLEPITPQEIRVHIVCEGGLYVKELATGDDGRTTPNLTNVLSEIYQQSIELSIVSLDVVGVHTSLDEEST